VDVTNPPPVLKLQTYEPTKGGITYDDNDVAYLDFTLSQMYPVGHANVPSDGHSWHGLPFLCFSFTGRFGQYLGTRASSPVVGKRFNPTVFGRYWLGGRDCLDLAYGHESNGQRTNTEEGYLDDRADLLRDGDDPDDANDFISRGWDYLGIDWHRERDASLVTRTRKGWESDLKLKYFLEDGILQGEAEEYNDWEESHEGRSRAHVDGITLVLALTQKGKPDDWFGGRRLAASYTTGYKDMFRFSTIRLEATAYIFDIPVMLWGSAGYNSDLVDYYRRVNTIGLAIDLPNFIEAVDFPSLVDGR